MLKNLVDFLSGKKTYLVSIGALIYALGIHQGWWSHQPDIDLAIGGTYGITIRAALKKLYLQMLPPLPGVRLPDSLDDPATPLPKL